jgi:hypothetical protein
VFIWPFLLHYVTTGVDASKIALVVWVKRLIWGEYRVCAS